MVFFHLAFAVELMALVMGTALWMWSVKNPGKGTGLGRAMGMLVLVLAIIAGLFTISSGARECRRICAAREQAAALANQNATPMPIVTIVPANATPTAATAPKHKTEVKVDHSKK